MCTCKICPPHHFAPCPTHLCLHIQSDVLSKREQLRRVMPKVWGVMSRGRCFETAAKVFERENICERDENPEPTLLISSQIILRLEVLDYTGIWEHRCTDRMSYRQRIRHMKQALPSGGAKSITSHHRVTAKTPQQQTTEDADAGNLRRGWVAKRRDKEGRKKE